jgi:hypothetical protein
MKITGLSMAAHAHAVTDRTEADKVLRMLPLKYPDAPPLPIKMPSCFKGFGHTDVVNC